MSNQHNGELIFIYGTLRRGGRAHAMMQTAEFLAMATISGRLYHISDYPGLILSRENLVTGELYRADAELMLELDRYEGCAESPPLYTREEVTATDESGETHLAQTYVFQRLLPQHKRIKSGDWMIQ